MSMSHGIQSVSEATLTYLMENPEHIGLFFAPPGEKPGLLYRLLHPKRTAVYYEKLATFQSLPPGFKEDMLHEDCSVDVMWQGLHYLFTGTEWEGDWPARFLMQGGKAVGDVDVSGYGPAWAYTPAQVEEIHQFLSTVTASELRERYNPETMDELSLYPTGWTEDSNDRLIDLIHYLAVLQEYFAQISSEKLGAICYLG